MVGSKQVLLVGVLAKDGRSPTDFVHASLIAVVASEAGRRIMISPEAEVIGLQGVAIDEDTLSPSCSFEDIAWRLRVLGHPEAIQVAQSVTLAFHHHAGIILDDDLALHLLLSPKRQPLGSYDVGRVATESHLVILRLRLNLPILSELFFVES